MKLTVVGAGTIGAGVAYNAAVRDVFDEIVLVDLNEEKALGEALDISHAISHESDTRVVAGDYSMAAHSDVVAVTAGKPRKEGMTRTDLLTANADVMAAIHENDFGEDAVFVTTTNPMDVINYTQYVLTGYPRERFVGFGGWLDSARFQYVLSQYLDRPASDVNGTVLGEHGETQVPVFSKVTCDADHVTIPSDDHDDIHTNIRQSAMDVISRKGFTQWAPTRGMATILEAIATDAQQVFPCSAVLDGEYGRKDLSIGVPCVIGAGGVQEVLEWELVDAEEDAFQASADKLEALCKQARELV